MVLRNLSHNKILVARSPISRCAVFCIVLGRSLYPQSYLSDFSNCTISCGLGGIFAVLGENVGWTPDTYVR